MAKVISQETFDDVVKDNIIEFDMSPEEAKQESIQQFEAQGVNLANIIKDLSINEDTGRPLLNEAIDSLKAHMGDEKLDSDLVIKNLNVIVDESKKTIPHRVLAAKSGAYDIILNILENEISSNEINADLIKICLRVANALTNKQPDIFDDRSLNTIINILKMQINDDILSGTLQWISKACIMHETNRQNLMNANIIQFTKSFVKSKNSNIIRDVCAVFQHLILDDDIRVEFGNAHEHARIIANEVLLDLVELLPEFDDVAVLADLLLTIATLVVRQDLCAKVEEAGCLKSIFNIMRKYPDELKLNREAVKLLRALAGDDKVKNHIVEQGAAPIINNILINHKTVEQLVSSSLACISTLTLRVKENSFAFFEAGVSESIVEAMRQHPQSKLVQRNAAWAIRNMVSRTREQCDSFLSFGVEELLNAAMTEHPTIYQDAKAALRDLGCKVDLKEEWTGKAEKKISNFI